jgi:uncharacterized protein YecE (DUF72 family)
MFLMMSSIYIGTSGWSYPQGEGTWVGHFYPRGKIKELEYYGQFFNTVEINSSFYRPPNPEYVSRWAAQVPRDFLFTVKLWQKFTHPRLFEASTGEVASISQADVDNFRRSLEPLVNSGKLGALLAQFPPSFKNDDFSRQILMAVIRTFGQYRLAVELRHRSWSDDETTAGLLREYNVAWVQIDEPQFAASVARELPLTASTGYFRFHGRNAEMWWRGNNETRYRYLYSQTEIQELASRVKSVSEQAEMTFALFNNHWRGYAPRNAIGMLRTLELPYQELPPGPDSGEGTSQLDLGIT